MQSAVGEAFRLPQYVILSGGRRPKTKDLKAVQNVEIFFLLFSKKGLTNTHCRDIM